MSDDLKFFKDGAAYERMMGRWSREVGSRFINWLSLPAGLRWLDVGCGNGAFTETIIARCAPNAVHGVDPSKEQIDYACSRDAGKPAQFSVGDALALPFDASAFDAATMGLVISFVSDPAKAVAEMARVVRPGGWVAAYMWEIPNGLPTAPFRRAAQALGLGTPREPPGLAASRLDGMEALWLSTGLSNVETRTIDIQITYESFDDFWQSSTALPNASVQFLQSLSASELDRVREFLRKDLVDGEKGSIAYGARANAVKGQVPG